MSTLAQVKTGLVNTLKLIKTAGGYTFNLPDDHIYTTLRKAIVDNTKSDAYPKCFVLLEEGTQTPEVGMVRKDLTFRISLILKKATANDDLEAMLENFIESVCTAIYNNDTLMGTVSDAQIKEFQTDGGSLDPEAAVVLFVETTRHERR